MSNNIYMEEGESILCVDVQPILIDELEKSKNEAAQSALQAKQSEENAKAWSDNITAYKTNLELFYAQATNGLESTYEMASTSINNAKLVACSYVQTAGQEIVNTAHEYAEEAKDAVDNRVSLDYLNQSKALESGNISTNTNLLPVIYGYAHSTYDSTKFTKVGSPTVTTDGIVSGFSSSNYLTVPTLDFSGATSWVVETPLVNFNSNTNTSFPFYWISGTTTTGLTLQIASNGVLYGIANIGGVNLLKNRNTDILQDLTKWYQFKFEFTGTQYNIYYREKDGAWINEGTLNSTTKIPAVTNPFVLGYGNNYVFNGSLDLKYFSIKIGNVPVFNGNITGTDTYTINGVDIPVPYTLSKTGSKISDTVYRPRVTAVYNAYGYAPYFTLSDTDFTLPMGEIYGMMGQRQLRGSYRNGINYWEIYSDGTIEQGGSCTNGTEVTFLKPFADSNYVISVPYSAKSATAFTPSVTGDWIAKGVGVL